ncbi:MAG: electron transfer flavoprotein subunit beta/FixA family protein [bacterium]
MQKLDILVCIKPVPDPKRWDKLKLDPETMLLARSEVPPVLNPLDRNALEQAVMFKTASGGTVTLLTMAPPAAEEQLMEALAMGCDRAVLLTDRAFAGADTLATARTLAAAIRKIGRYDLIFCGGYSLDGSTAQVGPQVAELLGIPDLTLATRVEIRGDGLRVACKVDDGQVVYEVDLPALVSFAQEANKPRLPSMVGLKKAAEAEIVKWTARDLGLDPAEVGLRGSPTQMQNVFKAPVGRKGEMLQGTPDELAQALLAKIKSERVLS